MSKLRSLNTNFWSDPFIEELKPDEKLIFIYLITNEKTNMLGIYELSIRKISFETGVESKRIETILKAFEGLGKVKYMNNYVILTNYLKHQNFNTNMKKSAIDCYNNLPKELKDSNLSISKDNPLEGFETLLNHYGILSKIEVEREVEVEDEKEVESSELLSQQFETFWAAYGRKVGRKESVKQFSKLKPEERAKILDTVADYVKANPDPKYRKHPERYLKHRCWEDELILPNEPEETPAVRMGIESDMEKMKRLGYA